MDAPPSVTGSHLSQPPQWTVGQLRAELVGVPDDVLLAVDVCLDRSGDRRQCRPLISAGYGHGIDPSDPLFDGQEYPLTAGDLDDEPTRPTLARSTNCDGASRQHWTTFAPSCAPTGTTAPASPYGPADGTMTK